ncbi:MAG: hypothetical protein ABIW84_01540 [Ilumatobacteraceae bacterium]
MKNRNLDPNPNEGNGNENILNPDLNALSRAEGAPESPDDIMNKMDLENLPNLDDRDIQSTKNDQLSTSNLDKQLDKELGVNQGTDLDNVQVPANDNQPGNEKPSVYDELIDTMATKYGEKFVINTEGLTQENVFDRVEEAILRATGKGDLHPEAQKLQDAIAAGVPVDEYYKQYNQASAIETMDAKALVELSLKQNFGKSEKRPNGWDDQKIADTLEKMDKSGYMEVEAEKIRSGYIQQKENLATTLAEKQRSENLRMQQETSTTREKIYNETIEYFNKLNDVNGVPLSQSEKTAFAPDFKYLITPDPKTGTAPLFDALQSNETLAKVAWFLRNGDAGIRKALTLAKEGAKTDFVNKLDKEPKVLQKGGAHKTSEINMDALIAPAVN